MNNVKMVFKDKGSDWESYQSVEIYVNDELVSEGSYGGEPEDNSRYRDYSWVESAIAKVALKLGATVMKE